MTAINPARLKMQTVELGALIDQADQFTAQLHELLAFYSARIRQTSLASTPLTLQAYQAPEPVLWALETEITERLKANPSAGYPLVDALWREPWVEFRRLAVRVLSILPTDHADLTLNRVRSWLETCTSEDIRRLIMVEGISRLSREKRDVSLAFIAELISSGEKRNHQAALFGLECLAEDPSYPNLPLVYKFLTQILQTDHEGLVKEISSLLKILATRSAQETTYFLLSQLGPETPPSIYRVARQVLGKLSPDNQQLLREKMADRRN